MNNKAYIIEFIELSNELAAIYAKFDMIKQETRIRYDIADSDDKRNTIMTEFHDKLHNMKHDNQLKQRIIYIKQRKAELCDILSRNSLHETLSNNMTDNNNNDIQSLMNKYNTNTIDHVIDTNKVITRINHKLINNNTNKSVDMIDDMLIKMMAKMR